MVPGGSEGGARKPRVNVARSLKDIIKDVERLERRRRKDQETTERVRWDLYVVENALAEQAGAALPRRPRRTAGAAEGPAPTVRDFQMREAAGGAALAAFDHAGQVKLPPALKELAAILAADEGESPDDLVAWKSFDRCCEWLEKRLHRGRKVDRHALAQLIWRLRKALAAAGLARGLIESVPALGARMRLQRAQPAALRAG